MCRGWLDSVPLFVFHKLFQKIRIVWDWGSLPMTGKGINLTQMLGSDYAGLNLQRFSFLTWSESLDVISLSSSFFSDKHPHTQLCPFFTKLIQMGQDVHHLKKPCLSFPNTSRETMCVTITRSKQMARAACPDSALQFSVWPNSKEQFVKYWCIDLCIWRVTGNQHP